MPIFVPVIRLNAHDIGIIYNDAERKQPDGGALLCMTWKRDTDSVSMNIKDFNNALLMGIGSVIFKIPHKNFVERVPMEKAKELMENGRQFDGADYKLLSIYMIQGHVELPQREIPF